jgi:cell division septation protein DedD
MAENRRGRDKRFYFSRGQMVLLGGAFALTAALIFILGVFVGKVIEENKVMKQEEPLVKIPVRPSAQGGASAAAPPPRNEITFDSSAAQISRAPSPAPAKSSDAKEAKPSSKAGAAAEHVATAKSDKAPLPGAAPGKSPPGAARDSKGRDELWRAQVNAFPDDLSANQLVDRLKNKGYNAYVTEVESGGRTWYRVSVGKFNNRADAEKAVETLRTKENFPKAFAASK